MEKYYTPKIEEFVEGFKYQVKQSLGYAIINFDDPSKTIKSDMKDYWFDRVVPNREPIEYPYSFKDEEGNNWIIMNKPFPEEDPLRMIKIMLKDGQIRAKKQLLWTE